MTTLPATTGASSPAIAGIVVNGTARTTTSASAAAVAGSWAERPPAASAMRAALAASRAANVTSWPARASEPPRAEPTLPVPMTAIFIRVLPSGRAFRRAPSLTVVLWQIMIAANETLTDFRPEVK